MKYVSTRDDKNIEGTRFAIPTKYSASEAILNGIADDGGLFIPESFSKVDFTTMVSEDYIGIAKKIFLEYLTDFPEEEIDTILHKAYNLENYQGQVAPLVKLDDYRFSLELWHGKTLACKDLRATSHNFSSKEDNKSM